MMTASTRTTESTSMTGLRPTAAFPLISGLLGGMLIGYFLLPLAAPRGWGQSAEETRKSLFLGQFASRDEAVAWLTKTADALDRQTQHLAGLTPQPLERRELDAMRQHLQQLTEDPTRKLDPALMCRAQELTQRLDSLPETSGVNPAVSSTANLPEPSPPTNANYSVRTPGLDY